MSEFEKIISRDNQRLVDVRKVRDGKAADRIFIEGRRLVAEAIRSDISIVECYVAEGFGERELVNTVSGRTNSIFELPERIFKTIADTDQPQGIVIIARRPATGSEIISPQTSLLPVTLFLKEINNPSNLGAVMRTAEAAGVAGVVVSKRSADVYSPKALRAAMGSSFRLPVWEDADLDQVLNWAKENNLITTAADVSAAAQYAEIDWKTPRLLIFGSEAHGLQDDELSKISDLIKIPMENEVESLNLAVSAGIIIFEAKRQNS